MNKAIVILCIFLLILCFYFLHQQNQKEDEEEYIFPIRTGVIMNKYIIVHTTALIGKENRLEQKRHFYIDVLSQGEILRFEIDAVAYGTYDIGEVIEWVR